MPSNLADLESMLMQHNSSDIKQGTQTSKGEGADTKCQPSISTPVLHDERCFLFWHPDGKVHGTNMEPTWGRQDPGGPHVGPMNLAIWAVL